MIKTLLWKIDVGMVRTLTLQESGAVITLGLWGVGDVVGHPLAGVEPYLIECLCKVQAHRLHIDDGLAIDEVMWSHIHQSQILQRMNYGSIPERLKQFLAWFAYKFGTKSEEGWRIPNRLTQQDIAEAIGTSRVTICRLLGELEQGGIIHSSKKGYLLSHRFQMER
ncbi:Crp/Fnr family transcriptional regulator [Acaryochloris thomasi]|nr:Crp/Fnr family transcriptional regulator [Acaryochloris thomasi]